MHKNRFRIVVAIAATVAAIESQAATIYTAIIDGIEWKYTISNGRASVGGGSHYYGAVPSGITGAITIPSWLGDYPVTSIGDYAFSFRPDLTSVTIPDSVTSIGNEAFGNCYGLTEATIPASVTSIGDGAFAGCYSLTSVTIPDGVTSIGDYTFSTCMSLTSVTIPASVTSIGKDAFSWCGGSLKSVHITDLAAWCGISFYIYYVNPLYFAGHLFLNGNEVTNLVIPSGVTRIGASAFVGCSSLMSVTIPDSVMSIGDYAFYGCSGLTSVTIPDSVMSIGDYAFYGCSGLTSVTIPDSVTSIGASAFEGCTGLPSVTIPGQFLFSSVFPDSYQSITNVVVAEGSTNITASAFSKCQGLISVTIPDSVTSIGDSAFSYCSDLTSMTIGNGVTSIGRYAFRGCSNLVSITIPISLLGKTSNADIPDGCAVTISSVLVEGEGEAFSWTAGDIGFGWSLATAANASDGYVLRSDEIGTGETAAIEAIVDGPGRLDFDWRISANRGDYARVYVDGVQRAQITRNTAWATASVAIDGDGPHTVRWAYEHRASAAANDNAAYLDNVSWHPMSLAEALDGEGLVWTTDEGAEWRTQLTVASDGEDAAVSGPVDYYGISGIETTVTGPGTLAWHWKLAVADVAGLDVIVDGDFGDPARTYEESGDWADDSLTFDDDGTHTIRFEFWNLGSVESDCAYLDRVSWTPAGAAEAVVVDGVEVPTSWLEEEAAPIVAANGGSLEAAAAALAANGVNKVWECYVAGISPTNETQVFRTVISWVNGEPRISWEPDLNENGTKSERIYTVEGKEALADDYWMPTNSGSHFFRVKVEMP